MGRCSLGSYDRARLQKLPRKVLVISGRACPKFCSSVKLTRPLKTSDVTHFRECNSVNVTFQKLRYNPYKQGFDTKRQAERAGHGWLKA
ncbi:hypothetical protein EMIT047CA2_80328 [Pseudomonas soli]